MTRIDFYQIKGDEMEFTCRLIAKIYRLGHQIHVHTGSKDAAKQLDEKLWAWPPQAFVPHVLADEDAGFADPAQVRIGFGKEAVKSKDVLINLAPEVPEFFSQFDRVAEVVPQDDQRRKAAREHYSFYKTFCAEQGEDKLLNYHQL